MPKPRNDLELAQARAAGLANIGRAAAASGVSAKMIRHYESIGLLAGARRTGAGYRVYDADELHTLRFIRRARDLGFPIDAIRALLSLWQDRGRASGEVKRLALSHAAELDGRIAQMQAMRDTLRHLAAHCKGDSRPQCPILDELATAAAGTPDRSAANRARPPVVPRRRRS